MKKFCLFLLAQRRGTVDHIKSQLDMLAELDNEQVSALQDSIIGEFDSVESQDPTPESVDAMTALADMLDTVRGEVTRRDAQLEELTAQAAEASSRVHEEAGQMEETMVPAEQDMPEEEMPAEEVVTEEEIPEEEAAMDETMEPTEEEAMETPEEEKKEPATPAEASTDTEEVAVFAAESDVVDATDELEVVEFATDESVVEETTEEFSADTQVEAEASVEEEVEAVVAAAEPDAEVEAETETPIEAEASIVEEITHEPQAQEEAPVTAAATEGFEAPADRRMVVQVTEAPVAITAGADIPGYTAGSTIDSMSDVAVAMEKRLHSLRRVNGGDGEQHIVASISTQYPESRTLGSDPIENRMKIEAVAGAEALVASGGFATPLDVRYDVFGLGSAVRPVRDSLPSFQADRGGIRYVTPPVLSSYADAVGVWTNATDTTPGGSTKATLTVTAAQELTAVTDAVTLQMQFGNLFSRAYPELLARHNELGLIQHAREAEQNLLSRIASSSTAVTTTSLIGFGRDFLVQIKRAAAAYRSRHRIAPETQLRSIIPSWVIDAISADLTLSMPGDGTLSVGTSEINGYLASSNVSLVASLDQNVFGAQATGALNEFADSFTWYLFAEGSFIFLDGGTLDLGIIRDSGLVGTNDYKMFVETFEGVAFVGTESLAITSTISVNGAAAALRDTTGAAAAAPQEY
jgi:chemotaxis protein histidine kinase CheA